jgi:Macrocin-O-methyltransferase (TylF)
VSRTFEEFVKKGLARAGIHIFRTPPPYAEDGLVTIHNDHFRRVSGFQAAYRRGLEAGGGVDPAFEWRVHVALWAAKASLRMPGDFIECGVNTGFVSSAIMHWLSWNGLNRRYFLVDTWAGPPIEQYNDTEMGHGKRRLAEEAMAAGAYATDLDRVRRNFAEWPSAVIVQGTVPEILPKVPVTEVAFLHLDMNCAYPESAALEFFWECLSPGAMVLLDDYAYHGYEQQAVAMDAAASAIGADILSLPTGQGIIIK